MLSPCSLEYHTKTGVPKVKLRRIYSRYQVCYESIITSVPTVNPFFYIAFFRHAGFHSYWRLHLAPCPVSAALMLAFLSMHCRVNQIDREILASGLVSLKNATFGAIDIKQVSGGEHCCLGGAFIFCSQGLSTTRPVANYVMSIYFVTVVVTSTHFSHCSLLMLLAFFLVFIYLLVYFIYTYYYYY